MIRMLILLVFLGGCTQQEEASQAETRYLGVLSNGDKTFFTGNVPLDDSGITWWIASPPKFDPTKHYIISVDTVGWSEVGTYYLDTTWWWQKNCCGDDSVRGFFADPVNTMAWLPILDTTWADKEYLLVTPTEKKKIKEWLDE